MSAPSPSEGQEGPRYRILGRLADGAMGQVYLARETAPDRSGRLLVLKRIRPELQTDPDIVMMFQDEARIASQMDHPNIVRLHEVGELDGSLFLAMELVEGVTVENLLSTLVEQRRFIPVELALTIALGILGALDYAHSFTDRDGHPLKLVHRDVSPQNLMVSYAGDVKLLDFGITRAEGRLHQTLPGLLKGKLAYMAPETIEGRPVDGRADLFSLGAVLYELLLLKHPFFGSTDAMVLRSIVEEPPVAPKELDPSFPESLGRVLLASLAKDPSHRIASAHAMRTAIHQYLQSAGRMDYASPEALGRFIRDVYAERVNVHEHAKSAGDDAMLLHALRGFVRSPSQRAAEVSQGSIARSASSTGPYSLPHSMVDLDYARVPTADLPVLRRFEEHETGPLHRTGLDDVLTDAYNEDDTAPGGSRAFETRLGRYQLQEVIEHSAVQRLQRAQMMGPLGFTKEVVLRRLPADHVLDPEWIAPLVREAKVRANLNHPHIEMLVDFDAEPEAFFALEPIDGRKLDQLLHGAVRGHRAPPPLGVALRITLDVVEALDYLHNLPEAILHRSIEPNAVHMHRSGRCKLTGFDAARPLGARSPHIFEPQRQSLDHLAPETVSPTELGPEGRQTDVYGVVLLLAECLTLTRPFLRDQPASVVQAILLGIDDSALADIPSEMRAVISQGLALDPAERFADMPALRAALVNAAKPAERAGVRDWFAGD